MTEHLTDAEIVAYRELATESYGSEFEELGAALHDIADELQRERAAHQATQAEMGALIIEMPGIPAHEALAWARSAIEAHLNCTIRIDSEFYAGEDKYLCSLRVWKPVIARAGQGEGAE